MVAYRDPYPGSVLVDGEPVSDSNPLPVAASGIAGGTAQYDEGDVDATVTGIAVMWEDAADTMRSVSAAKPLPVQLTPSTAGGLSLDRNLDVDETEDAVKASAGQLYGWVIYNNAASARYVKYYDATVANVTVGSTTPKLTIPLAANGKDVVSIAEGIPFAAAITVAATTGVGDADTGAPAANDVIVHTLYK